jgi:hypothetical protein
LLAWSNPQSSDPFSLIIFLGKGGRNQTVNHEKSNPKGMAISEQERHIQTRTIQ